MQEKSAAVVYKILTAEQWLKREDQKTFSGAPIDLKDGYIHLSSAEQVVETAAKHFAGQSNLYLIAIKVSALGDALRWEHSRGGALFPHLYGQLDESAVLWSAPLSFSQSSGFRFPDLETGALPD